MRPLFEKQLDVLLEDVELFAPVSDALQHLDSAKEAVREAEASLARKVDAIHSQLALEIRRASPAINVTMGRDGTCCARHKNYKNCLRLWADPDGSCFEVGDTPFERRFRRYHGHCFGCGPDVLGKAVGDFFRQSYRSLR